MSEEINAEILAEIRKLKRRFTVILIFVVIGSVPAFYAGFMRGSPPDSWDRARTAMSRQDFPAALSMARALVTRQPNYYYGHAYLGFVLLLSIK